MSINQPYSFNAPNVQNAYNSPAIMFQTAMNSFRNIDARRLDKERFTLAQQKRDEDVAYREKSLAQPELLRQKHQQEVRDILLGADSKAEQYGNAINAALVSSDNGTGPKVDETGLGNAILKSGKLDALTNENDLQSSAYKLTAALNSGNKDAYTLAKTGYDAAVIKDANRKALLAAQQKTELENIDYITNKQASLINKGSVTDKALKSTSYAAKSSGNGKGAGKSIRYTGNPDIDRKLLDQKWKGILSKTTDWSGIGYNEVSDKINNLAVKQKWSPEQIDQAFQYALQNDNGSWITKADGLNIMNDRLDKFKENNVNTSDSKAKAKWDAINQNNYINTLKNNGYQARSKTGVKIIPGNVSSQENKLSSLLKKRGKAIKAVNAKYATRKTPKQEAYDELMSILTNSSTGKKNPSIPGSEVKDGNVNNDPSETNKNTTEAQYVTNNSPDSISKPLDPFSLDGFRDVPKEEHTSGKEKIAKFINSIVPDMPKIEEMKNSGQYGGIFSKMSQENAKLEKAKMTQKQRLKWLNEDATEDEKKTIDAIMKINPLMSIDQAIEKMTQVKAKKRNPIIR